MLFEDLAWKNKFTGKNYGTQEKQRFLQTKNDKKRINDIFWKMCPKTKRFFEEA